MKNHTNENSSFYPQPLILEAVRDITEDGKVVYKKGTTLYAFKNITPESNDPLDFLAGQFLLVTPNKDGSGPEMFIAKSQVKEIGKLER